MNAYILHGIKMPASIHNLVTLFPKVIEEEFEEWEKVYKLKIYDDNASLLEVFKNVYFEDIVRAHGYELAFQQKNPIIYYDGYYLSFLEIIIRYSILIWNAHL